MKLLDFDSQSQHHVQYSGEWKKNVINKSNSSVFLLIIPFLCNLQRQWDNSFVELFSFHIGFIYGHARIFRFSFSHLLVYGRWVMIVLEFVSASVLSVKFLSAICKAACCLLINWIKILCKDCICETSAITQFNTKWQ